MAYISMKDEGPPIMSPFGDEPKRVVDQEHPLFFLSYLDDFIEEVQLSLEALVAYDEDYMMGDIPKFFDAEGNELDWELLGGLAFAGWLHELKEKEDGR